MNNKRKIRWRSVLFEVLLIAISVPFILPMYIILVNSFKPAAEANLSTLTLPKEIIWANYTEVLKKGKIPLALMNSSIIAFSSVFVLILFCSIAAFVIERRQDKTAKLLNGIMMAGLIVPPSIVPIYFVLKTMNLTNSFVGVIAVFVAVQSPLSVFLFHQYIKSIDRQLDESAIMDGCGTITLFFRIIFPLLKPVTVTVLIFNAINIWNNFEIPLYFLSSGRKVTLPMTVYFFSSEYKQMWNYIYADIIYASLPILIVYFLLQKHIVAGLTAGAIKG